jgi:hypothetical protein
MKYKLVVFLKTYTRSRVFYIFIIFFFLFLIVENFSSAYKNEGEKREISRIQSSELPASSIQNEFVEMEEGFIISTKTDSIIEYAQTLQGIPYKWAGKTPQGFDCSGFIFHVFKVYKIDVPAGSVNLYQLGKPITKDELLKGDLVFFTGTQKNDHQVGHVGMIISNPGDKLQFIHSSSGGGGRGVTINELDHHHYAARYLGARRIELM